ncbi:MAG: preprotein translocase subunit YajC [Acidobacteria bacterium]|nr:preprotein translocase subunit YajC [Acidobacteriota bacterium]
MPDLITLPLIVALASAPQAGQPNIWVQIFPFALMLGVFYVLVLLPMRRRQKKIQEFQAGLQVGDKVITTSGIYGQVTKLADSSVQLQIADKVKIEVAKASVGGYQGQEPVVKEAGGL